VYFDRLTSASGLESLTSIGGDADFHRLTSASGLESLASIGGYGYFSRLPSRERKEIPAISNN
jgi:hypothetical protein